MTVSMYDLLSSVTNVTNEESESGTMSSLSSREIFNNNNDNHSNNNNNSATTITRYIHIKHADSSCLGVPNATFFQTVLPKTACLANDLCSNTIVSIK
ncbi:hypothetical protein E2986_11019 [Frieseomelitta varia]|uniref:Uncharacterized protein n=1 Tax=Frieseomelitta varia TaxID=561572 RepID=A0A833SA10_9HYME|nr:hypothetical protein E2986_11019 [Frieseomelitta varia]